MTSSVQVMHFLEAQSKMEFDSETVKQFELCRQENFPVCLHDTLAEKHGNVQQRKTVVEEDIVVTSVETKSASRKRIWNIYVQTVSELEKTVGKEETNSIEREAVRRMESMNCKKCPMYRFELDRLGKLSLSG